MLQSRLGSLIETGVNILIGYGVAVGSQIILFPWFGIDIPLSSNFWIGTWFTLISLIRQYVVRRWFNARLHKASLRLATTLKQEPNGKS